MWQKMEVSKNFCDKKRYFFFKIKEEYKFSCVKLLFCSVTKRSAFIRNIAHLIHRDDL